MADFRTRLIIVSNMIKFKMLLSSNFQGKPGLEVISNVYSITQLSQMCIKNRKNIVILDINEQPTLEPYLKSLSQKFHVLIISVDSGFAKNLFESYKTFMKRPDLSSDIDCQSFIWDLESKITHYLEKTAMLSPRHLAKTIDENSTIIAIGSSTGGTEALLPILQHVNADCPPILIVQHMPMGFTKLYADRLDKICPINIREAKNGDFLQQGTALIAPGDFHMKLVKKAGKLCVECFVSEKMNGVRPAADILFQSVAQIVGSKAIGLILTGMGSDGAKGLFEMHKRGSHVIGQNQETCIVYGMPKAAFDLGAVDIQLPLGEIADHLNSLITSPSRINK